jgi:hypothetical protein
MRLRCIVPCSCRAAVKRRESYETKLHSPYLDHPLLPLNVALPRMLDGIEANLAEVRVDAVEKEHLRQRAELIRWLLNWDEPVIPD